MIITALVVVVGLAIAVIGCAVLNPRA